MIGRVLGVGALLLLAVASAAVAAVPAGPRLALVKVTELRMDLLTVDETGAQSVRLAGGDLRSGQPLDLFSPLAWSPDGKRVAFAVGLQRGDQLFTVSADGRGLRSIRGTNGATGPVFSPDGRTIAFTRNVLRRTATRVGGKLRKEGFAGASVWVVDILTGAQRQLTPWRNRLWYFASSFSPDGSTLLTTRWDVRRTEDSEPVAVNATTGAPSRLLADGDSPVYSPDGLRVALTRESEDEATDLYVVDADGSDIRRLTRTRDRIEAYPNWDPAGDRLAYMRVATSSKGAGLGIGNALMQINADGSCPTKLLFAPPTGFYMPAWQPGPGREAGRISC